MRHFPNDTDFGHPVLEEQKFQFRGSHIPPEILCLVEEGVIKDKEAWLLIHVDNLVNNTGKDCWASNSYFAARLRVTKEYVNRMIRHLKTLGLLVQTSYTPGGKRYLATCWSRLKTGGPLVLQTEGGKPTDEGGLNLQTEGGLLHSLEIRVGRRGFQRIDAKTPTGKQIRGSTKDKEPRQGAGDMEGKRFFPWGRLSATLHASIQKAGWVGKGLPKTPPPGWTTAFATLHKKATSKEIVVHLEWYARHLQTHGDPNRRACSCYCPVVESANSFVTKWAKIKDAKTRCDLISKDPTESTRPDDWAEIVRTQKHSKE